MDKLPAARMKETEKKIRGWNNEIPLSQQKVNRTYDQVGLKRKALTRCH